MLKEEVASIDKIEYIESPLNIIERLCCFVFLSLVQTLYKPCANHRHARMALVMLGGRSVWLTPISRGRVSHSDSGLNTVGGVLACPWFVNDWHSFADNALK